MTISRYLLKDFNKFKNYINKFFLYDDNILPLGRWCHKGLPKCDESVIEKKIKFALLDNNLCTNRKNYNKK